MNKCDKLLIPAFQPMTVYLSISTTPEWTKGMQNGHWQPCRISLSAKSGCFLSLLSLDVFMQGWEFTTMKRVGGQLSEWPAQEGSIKTKKESKSKGWMTQKAGEEKTEERGHPCRVPGISAGSPHLGFRRLLSKRGKEGLFFTWAWDNRRFVSQMGGWGQGCWWRDMEGCWKRNKEEDPSSQGMGWRQWAALWDWADVETRMIY